MEILSCDIFDKFDDLLPLSELHLPCLDLDFPVIDEIGDFDEFLEQDVSEDRDVSEDSFSRDGLDYIEKNDPLHDHSYASVMILGFNQDSFQTQRNVKSQKTFSKIRSTSVTQLRNNEVLLFIFFPNSIDFSPFQLKREIHNNQEKIRRALLNIRYDDLRQKLPKTQSADKTLSKKSVLDLAKIYCQKLETDLHSLKKRKKKLLKHQKNLQQIRSKLKEEDKNFGSL